METKDPGILPSYDFSEALSLGLEARFELSVQRAKEAQVQSGYSPYMGRQGLMPAIPPIGATSAEVTWLEQELEVKLPYAYTQFLRRWRYLDFGRGRAIWGLAWQGIYGNEGIWMSDEYTGTTCLVVGDYWRFADGDQLLLAAHEPQPSMLSYLHEYRGKIETFAPLSHLGYGV